MSKILDALAALNPKRAPAQPQMNMPSHGSAVPRRNLVPALAALIAMATAALVGSKWMSASSPHQEIQAAAATVDSGPNMADLFARNRSAITAFYLGDFKQSEEDLRAIVMARPGDPTPKSNLGMVLLRSGKKDEAKKLFTEALTAEPLNPVALNGLGKVYLEDEKVKEAEVFFSRSLASAPSRTDTLLNLGQAAELQNHWATASVHYIRYLQQAQTNDAMRPVIAARLEKIKNLADAVTPQQEATK
jgi:predicted Zn-dependent protease